MIYYTQIYGFYAISYFDSNKNFLNRATLSLSEETYEGKQYKVYRNTLNSLGESFITVSID